MTQLRQDDNGDLLISNNRFSFTENNSDEEISQRLKQALKTFLAEWFLDSTIGIPYFQAVFVKGTPPEIIAGLFKDAIIAVQGVLTLTRFDDLEYDPATRELKVSFDVTTINGNNLTINEVLP